MASDPEQILSETVGRQAEPLKLKSKRPKKASGNSQIDQMHDVQNKMKNLIKKFKQKSEKDSYLINYLQQENRKLRMENERLANLGYQNQKRN